MSREPTIRLTMAQALLRFLINQNIIMDGTEVPFFAGTWAIFGHGNVTGLGEALYHLRDRFPTYRAHNEQSMAHAAIAFAKAQRRQRSMICTTSIGPGATNMVTAAALAHVNRLPVLFLPGDIFANRHPDPVLQQLECFADGTVSANDSFRAVSRYFDRITRPEQILSALPQTMRALTDPVTCGPVTLALCQDVQTEAFDYPCSFFEPRIWSAAQPIPSQPDLDALCAKISTSERPLLISGGGVHYANAYEALRSFVDRTGVPVGETQAGKGALPWNCETVLGGIGVTGSSAANAAARESDLIIALGSRLQDFTTASRSLFEAPGHDIIQININPYDGVKHGAAFVQGDVRLVLEALLQRLPDYQVSSDWRQFCADRRSEWESEADRALSHRQDAVPSDASIIGALARCSSEKAIIVCAAGGLPGELHKLWQTRQIGDYHVEYGYSCMGYEIAAGLGVKMAQPDRDVYVMVGDGSYMMMNSELATAVAFGLDLVILVLDNRGFACINRLQKAAGGAPFNNLFADSNYANPPAINFAQHAEAMGAHALKVNSVSELESQLVKCRNQRGVHVLVIETDPEHSTEAGGAWWDVAIPEVSTRHDVMKARARYIEDKQRQNRTG